MTKIKDDSFDKLKEKSRDYNKIVATIIDNKKYHKKEALTKVADSIDRLVAKAKAKLEA